MQQNSIRRQIERVRKKDTEIEIEREREGKKEQYI